MKILAVHNRYQRHGGEDVVFDAETDLLERHGEQVVRFVADNGDIGSCSRASLGAKAVWNLDTIQQVREIARSVRPDVMHVHNTLPLISPSVYRAAHEAHVPVVQTLHNYRLLCPGALLLRNGAVCEECVGTVTRWPGIVHGCYRGNRAATATVATMLATHTLLGTWRHRIDRYIALSEFAKDKFLAAGWPAEKFVVEPNFLEHDPGMGTGDGGYALYVGRLSAEKGLRTLLRAWERLPDPPPLKIAGAGPLMPTAGTGQRGVEWLGHQTRADVTDLMKAAGLLIVPSESYENSPLAIIEAFAAGTPIITSRLGAMHEMVEDGVTGRLFTPGDADDLAKTTAWALDHPAEMAGMAANGRVEFESKYTAERHYTRLIDIYREAMNERRVHITGNACRDRDNRGNRARHGAASVGAGTTSG